MKRVSCFLLTVFIVFVSVVPTFAIFNGPYVIDGPEIFDGPDIFDSPIPDDAIVTVESDFVSMEDFFTLNGSLPYVNFSHEAIYPFSLNQWSYSSDVSSARFTNPPQFVNSTGGSPASGYSDSYAFVSSGSGPMSLFEDDVSYYPLFQAYCAFPEKPSGSSVVARYFRVGFYNTDFFTLDLDYTPSSSIYGISGSFYFGTRLYYGCARSGSTEFLTYLSGPSVSSGSNNRLPESAICYITFDDGTVETISMLIGDSYSSDGLVSIALDKDYYFGKLISNIRISVTPHFLVGAVVAPNCVAWADSSSQVAGRYEFSFAFQPQFVLDSNPPPFDYEGAITGIQDSLQNIENQLTSSGTQNSASQGTLSKMEELMQQIEELNQTIMNNTNRPNPSDVVTGLDPSYFNPTDPAAQAGLQGIGSLMSNSFLISLMLMVLTLALMRYILFGKR